MKPIISIATSLLFLISGTVTSSAQIINAYGRKSQSLNGEWHAIIDPFESGRHNIWKNQKPRNKNEFREFSFDEGLILNVPGDFNSQLPELKYYEGTVWYGRYFDIPEPAPGERLLLYFAGVANVADVYLNAQPIGHHEGGFTPFQIDITDKVKGKGNFLALAVNNNRHPDAIPAMNFDWWNYGGITRDVLLICVPDQHIADYFLRLDKDNPNIIHADVSLSNPEAGKAITLEIQELKVSRTIVSDSAGKASDSFKVKGLSRWDIDNPKLYSVSMTTDRDTISEDIGFRNIATRGTEILLNGRPVFLCGVNIHEEIPQRKGRAFSEADAAMLLNEAKELGVNFIRLAHYPQNEHILRMAEKMGIMLWEEIPVWQKIDFGNPSTQEKAVRLMTEMVNRDKNRAAVAIWSIANETWPSPERNRFLTTLKETAEEIDDSRLIGGAFSNAFWNDNTKRFEIHDDPVVDILDVVGVNKYLGWYENWHCDPSATGWEIVPGKPLIFSEFGGEALFGNHADGDAKWSWSEDYQADLYRKNIEMFETISNLAGVAPWVLFDFRSPTRFSPLQGLEFNRKGLTSDRGERKEAWRVMRDYYRSKKQK